MAANLSPQMSPQNYKEARTMTADQAQRTLAPRQLKPMQVQEYLQEQKRDVVIELGGSGSLRVKDFASKTLLYKIVLPKGKVMRKGANDVQLIPYSGQVFTFRCETGADSQIAFKAIESWCLLSEVPLQKSSASPAPSRTMSPRTESATKAAEDKARAEAIAAVAAKKEAKARAEKQAVDDALKIRQDNLDKGPDPALVELRKEMAEQKKKENQEKQKQKDAAAEQKEKDAARKKAKDLQMAEQARDDLKLQAKDSPIRPKPKPRPSTPTRKLDDNDPFAAKAKEALRQSDEHNKQARAAKKALRGKESGELGQPEGAAAAESASTTTGEAAEASAAPAEASAAPAEARVIVNAKDAKDAKQAVPTGRGCCSIC